MVATGIVLTALVMLGGVLTSGITATGISRQRQSATGLANQTMEQIRALPFDTMARGLSTADLVSTVGTSDTNVTTSGCGAAYCFGGERVVNNVNGAVDPLVPHTKTLTVGPNAYTIRSYVTNYQNNTTNGTYRATVIVNWTSGLQGAAAKKVQVQTIIYTQSAGSCLSTATHTRAGPCQAAFTSSALAEPGTIALAGTLGGVNLERARLVTGRATSDATVEQTWQITGAAEGAGATLKAPGVPEVTIGRGSVSSHADNDPGSPNAIYDTHALPGQASGSTSLTSGADSITVATTGGDSGGTTSTTAACTAPCIPATPAPRNCPNLSGFTNDNDNQPCGGSTSTSGSTITASANMATLGSINLAALGPQLTPTTATTDRSIGPATGACVATPTTGEGCTVAKLSRSATNMSAGALPSNLSALFRPVGFTYFVQIQGVTDSVTAEAGKSTGAPTASQSAGTVRVYCAGILGPLTLCPVTGYVTTAISSITGPVTLPILAIADLTLGVGGTTINMSATITPGSTSTTSSCSGTCDRTSATAKSQPPSVSLNYTIVTGGTTRLSLSYTLDPGAITTRAGYAPAPTS
jgi:hypothetical protein